ncbi:toll-like receptor 2 type-2 [Babylonia areolata]|uniref:toll-like receptor 2 type-2 n=1 Tax=Babylonia areolata TaxID=304850 RepID=UPI003FD0880B
MRPVTSLCLAVFLSVMCVPCVRSHGNTSSMLDPWSPGPVSHVAPRAVIRCDKFCCNCNGKKARCTGQNRSLPYLPRLPPQIRDFRLFRAQYNHLTRTMMHNLSNFQLTMVNLTNNRIQHIDPDTFADFLKMELLDLSINLIPIPELRATLKGLHSTTLTTLALGDMGYSSLPDNFFDMFSNRTFKKVDLQHNNFKTFNSALFSPFWRTDTVYMALNKIRDVNMSMKINIKILILKENWLEEFPDLSLNKSQTAGDKECKEGFYYLQALDVSGNLLRRIRPDFLRGDCFPHLRHLDISSAVQLDTLENQVIADLPKLLTFVVSRMKITHYQPFAFNSSSLTNLQLDGNSRLDYQKMDFNRAFKYCPNLQKLSISDTKLDMTTKQMFFFLLPLKSVRELKMLRTRHGTIPPDLLWRLPKLETLVYTGANINSYGLGRALENVTSLVRLNVQANGITEVNETTLPAPFRYHVQWIDLSQNPFSCTCRMLWFRNWVDTVRKKGNVTINKFQSRQYRCRTPENMAETPLHEFRPTAESCAVRNPLILVGVVGAAFLLGLLLLLAAVYRYRWHLRYYVYLLRRRRQYVQVPGGLLTENGDQVAMFPYDAYLAHSPKDLDWVVDTLLPIVEGEHGLKVFVEERDSAPGAILDNIARYMDESARVMLLISDHYNREGWRQGEFEHVLFAAFEQHKDVIVLLLGDVEAGRMTRDMRRMLTRGTFLQWGDSQEAQTAFLNGLKVALKTQDVNLQSIC